MLATDVDVDPGLELRHLLAGHSCLHFLHMVSCRACSDCSLLTPDGSGGLLSKRALLDAEALPLTRFSSSLHIPQFTWSACLLHYLWRSLSSPFPLWRCLALLPRCLTLRSTSLPT